MVNYLEDNIDDKQLLLGVYMTVFLHLEAVNCPLLCQGPARMSVGVCMWLPGNQEVIATFVLVSKVNYPFELGDEVRI